THLRPPVSWNMRVPARRKCASPATGAGRRAARQRSDDARDPDNHAARGKRRGYAAHSPEAAGAMPLTVRRRVSDRLAGLPWASTRSGSAGWPPGGWLPSSHNGSSTPTPISQYGTSARRSGRSRTSPGRDRLRSIFRLLLRSSATSIHPPRTTLGSRTSLNGRAGRRADARGWLAGVPLRFTGPGLRQGGRRAR
ncbi:MAG: hypothetical protein QOI36_1068, partial [Pseudonocardiales bacterium]|nr:hypothetical protein [Pseudonocardiales bacterium]